MNVAYNVNAAVISKTPLAGPLDFLFPAHSTSLDTIAQICTAAAHGEIEPQIWTNEQLVNYEA